MKNARQTKNDRKTDQPRASRMIALEPLQLARATGGAENATWQGDAT